MPAETLAVCVVEGLLRNAAFQGYTEGILDLRRASRVLHCTLVTGCFCLSLWQVNRGGGQHVFFCCMMVSLPLGLSPQPHPVSKPQANSTAHTHSCTQTEFKVVPNTKHALQPKLLGTLFCLVLLFCPYDVEEWEG